MKKGGVHPTTGSSTIETVTQHTVGRKHFLGEGRRDGTAVARVTYRPFICCHFLDLFCESGD